MARVYAMEAHAYVHFQQTAPTRIDYVFPKGETREVPDDIAEMLVAAHPGKLRIVGAEPELPYNIVAVTAPPEDRQMRPQQEPRLRRVKRTRRKRE